MKPHCLRGGLGGQAHGAQLAGGSGVPGTGWRVGSVSGLCSPRPPSPPSEKKKKKRGFGHQPRTDGLTGIVSLNDRDTMCINRVIASDPCGVEVPQGQNQSYGLFGLRILLPAPLVPLSSFQGGPGAGDRPVTPDDGPLRATLLAHSLRCWDL